MAVPQRGLLKQLELLEISWQSHREVFWNSCHS